MNDCSLPVGSPALHFLAGQVSVGDFGSENEAVLVVAGVWQRKGKDLQDRLTEVTKEHA